MTEVWVRVEGWPREVSDQGRVRNLRGRILKPCPNSRGYLRLRLAGNGSPIVYVHRLVAAAFCGEPKPGDHVDHINHDRTDNRAVNLRWCHPIVNSVRWAGRIPGTRRNLWETPDDVPEDYVPMTEQERDEYYEAVAGW
jgi:hypothetical protein